jgi:hypothetical protein
MANHNKLRNQCVDESKNMVTSILFFLNCHRGESIPPDIHSNDDVKKNVGGKQDLDQDLFNGYTHLQKVEYIT